jgi:RNA polymerase sigma-70 factor (ECF subfamily)
VPEVEGGEVAFSATVPAQEHELLAAARAGDEGAFRQIVEQHHARLHAHCYRMLGSVHDAEDALQETLVRAWRGLASFEGRSAALSWLYSIATNVCLTAISKRPKRALPIDYGPPTASSMDDPGRPLVETVWIEPYPDEAVGLEDGYAAADVRYEQREAIELAFIAALQLLPARQRAVLILREVLGFSAAEVSESLGTTIASVNSALQRARRTVEDRLPERSQQATVRSLGDERIRSLVDAYVEAWSRGDVDAVRELLVEDAVFSMPPWPAWWHGSETIARFAEQAAELCAEARTIRTRANGQPAVAYFQLDDETGRWKAAAIDVLTLRGERLSEITAFVDPRLFPRFGLPLEVRRWNGQPRVGRYP